MRTLAQRNEDAVDEAWLLERAHDRPAYHPDPKRAASYERLERALASLPYPERPAKAG